ncbi:MAG: hypothetical protein CVT48_03045 [Thermoplasmata archaeon HGW-Thermoplasmata-1]|nr:MAG: hypothetical protein CVT48_03045 [Thermoplasmata archaeon HGW-Thermoplasmata-1]
MKPADAGVNPADAGMKPAKKLGKIISRMSLYSASHPHAIIALISACTLVMVGGMALVNTSSNMVNILPRDNPNTLAAHNISREFALFYEFTEPFFTIDESKWDAANEKLPYRMTQANRSDVLDEVYVRGIEEFCQFVEERSDARYFINIATIVKTLNWTNSGIPGVREPQPEAFSMPGTDPEGEMQYYYAWQGVMVDPAYDDTVSPDHRSLYTVIFFDRENLTHIEIGETIYRLVDEYRAWAPKHAEFDVFDLDQVPVFGTPVTDAYAAKVLGRDISLLGPMVFVFIVFAIFLAFRNARAMLASLTLLIMSGIWTIGLMGYAGIPFSALNLAILPLILGNGIDYSIHMIGEYFEHRGKGLGIEKAFETSGSRAGLAMLIATLTTVIGLLMMVFSPSVLMAQLGFVSAIAMTVTFLLTITYLPALLALTASKKPTRKSKTSLRVFPAIARWVNRKPALGIISLALATFVLAAFTPALKVEAFGDPELNYPPGHRLRDDHDWIDEVFWKNDAGSVTNMIVLEGDATQPAVHDYLDRLEENLRNDADLAATQTASITRLVAGYVAVKDGTAGGALNMGQEAFFPGSTYPQTQEEIKQTMDDLFSSPMANYASFFIPYPDYDIALLTFQTAQEGSYEDAERVWNSIWRVVDETNGDYGGSPPGDVKVSVFGPTAFSYLFISEEMPWVNYMGIVSLVAVGIILFLLTKSPRATSAVVLVVALSSIWWYGILSIIGIGLSVTMMLPLIFIIALGSDYAVHLIWNIEHSGNRAECYGYVGKAVFYSALTDFGAFMIFIGISDLMVRKAMIATALAIFVTFIATMVVVPLFYPIESRKAKASSAQGNAPAASLPPAKE